MNQRGRDLVKEAALKIHTVPPGRTTEVTPCRFCLFPIFCAERDTCGCEDVIFVLEPANGNSRLCSRCKSMSYAFPDVVRWIDAVMQAHMICAHEE